MRVAIAGGTGVVGRHVVEGALGKAMRDGTLVPDPGADHGTQTYADWLRSAR